MSYCLRAYITVALPSQRAAGKTHTHLADVLGALLPNSLAFTSVGTFFVGFCVSQASLPTVPTETPEMRYINAGVFVDVT